MFKNKKDLYDQLKKEFAAADLKTVAAAVKNIKNIKIGLHRRSDRDAIQKIQELIHRYHYSPVDIEKAMKRGLDLQVLFDYLTLRNCCEYSENFNIRNWKKIPADQTELILCYDRICKLYKMILKSYNLGW